MTMFCQGNKAQLTAAATYLHSERECKLAPMEMSQRVKKVLHNFQHPRHFSEAQMLRLHQNIRETIMRPVKGGGE